MMTPSIRQNAGAFDSSLRLYIYRHFIRKERAPTVVQMAAALHASVSKVRAALQRLAQSHAFVLEASGELWRAAPFSAVPTPFPVQVGRRRYWGNCIWDALGIPAMLHRDAHIEASCGCCNYAMPLHVVRGKLAGPKGVIHIAVPARDWYRDIVFT